VTAIVNLVFILPPVDSYNCAKDRRSSLDYFFRTKLNVCLVSPFFSRNVQVSLK